MLGVGCGVWGVAHLPIITSIWGVGSIKRQNGIHCAVSRCQLCPVSIILLRHETSHIRLAHSSIIAHEYRVMVRWCDGDGDGDGDGECPLLTNSRQ